MQRIIVQAAESLLSLRVGTKLLLFSDMIRPPITSKRLHRLFALLRGGIVRISGDRRCALDAPVYGSRKDDGFPLHADLFLTNKLWLIFDDVPEDRSGQSLFLPARRLLQLTESLPAMPAARQRELRRLLTRRRRSDSFDQMYRLLYDEGNDWSVWLGKRLVEAQKAIKFRSGQGYLIDDRHWLHGRSALNGNVPRSRFRRLVFGKICPD